MKPHFNRILKIMSVIVFLQMALPAAWALEVYSLLDEKCQLREGLILGITPTQVEMLGLDGQYSTIERENLRHLAIYNTVDNPIGRIEDHPRLRQLLVEIYVRNSDEPSFIGWPVKFVENLVIFFDLRGKTHVFELFKIRKIRPFKGAHIPAKKLAHDPVKLSYVSWVSDCQLPGKGEARGNRVRPTRMLGDQIQISEFLTQFENGFEDVKSFQERTYVYARPFLYEKSTKLGFLVNDEYQLNPKSPMPMYFQWTKGREFRFQSFNQVGSLPIEYLPTVEPLMTFRSDLKSHIFHATFVGNLSALAAGTEYFTPAQDQLPIDPSKPSFRAHSAASVNYMALMGGDWGPWSLSVGTYFPVFMVQVRNEFREILASKLAPVFRLMYTGPNFRLRGLIGQTQLDGDGGVSDTQVSRDENLSVVGYLQSYDFDSQYVRVGVDYQFNPELEFTLDQLWLQASYEENLVTSARNAMDFSHLVTQASVRHFFGEYVALRAYINFFKVEEDYNFSGFKEVDSTSQITYGGTFEFIF
ncbi:MAG: hypothetical protein H6624_02885 [Bdellovibrionaceae bacterium]|nr:hypothetical protein [Bdellovibrionales bacterium]MCB9083258.1 hypothetical protein [Pseudobdellovibrionaceae bacterium]